MYRVVDPEVAGDERWMRLDLPTKASALGVPVRHVEARESQRALAA
ncbi:MAG: hypothetical protein JWN32_2179 [Solirubrobacterales bacterium]|jgi:hypothetical protein|nr:hypothetical protein [Solirubrobacterales bacterium]